MNMNKIFKSCVLILFSFFLLSNTVLADGNTTTSTSCNNFSTKKECDLYGKCRWMSGTCQEQYVASEPCSDNNIRKVLRIGGYVIQLVRLMVPLLIIILGTFDLYNAMIDKDEKLIFKKVKLLLMRVLVGVVIFFIPTIVKLLFSFSGNLDENSDEYNICEVCLLEPENCSID